MNFGPNTFQVDLAESPDFDLGELHVSPARREVEMNDRKRVLEPRVAQVLVALASARPGVVSRDRLIELCWEGRVVGDDAINRCIVALRHLAKDFTPEPFAINTVPRVGYYLVEASSRRLGETPRSKNIYARAAALGFSVVVLITTALFFIWPGFDRSAAMPTSIAVLSFRNVSSGDPFLAEGISEEVLSQLSRNPHFRVAGRASSAAFGKDADIRQVARRLDVDYLVEGSVRSQGDLVRVSANLVRARDSSQIWSDTYEGSLKDIFAIQQRVGISIAGALRVKLAGSPVLSGPLVTRGEAYNLYLTARGLIRTHNRRAGSTATGLLRDALQIDPGYAPAWASLAQATYLNGALRGHEGIIAVRPRSRAFAQHSLRLAPDFAEGHYALGLFLGYGTPEFHAHRHRAAQLDPNNSENLVSAGVAYGAAGHFDQELDYYRRANEIDPLFFRTVGQLAGALAEMGHRSEAEKVARRGLVHNPINMEILLGRIAFVFGDYSETVRLSAGIVKANSPRWSEPAKRNLNDAKLAVGMSNEPTEAAPGGDGGRRRVRVWMDTPPSPAVWQKRNRNAIAADVYRDENHVAAKLMLNVGRSNELVAAYDGEVGLLTISPGQSVRVDQLRELPVVALALRQHGRRIEAGRLLREGAAVTEATYRRGKTPFWFDWDAAALWAVLGQNDKAVSILERAFRRGWRHAGHTDLRNLTDEPAFRSLRGSNRFQRLQAKIASHGRRERAEVARLGI